jgi:hypothetical protein
MTVNLKADQETAGQLRTSWFGSVSEISDIDLQRRSWLDPTNQNPHWSFIEFVSSYPDHHQILQARQDGWLSAKEAEILDGLRPLLDGYSPPRDNPYDNLGVLDDPAWHSIVAAASRAKERLLSITNDQRERAVLLGND